MQHDDDEWDADYLERSSPRPRETRAEIAYCRARSFDAPTRIHSMSRSGSSRRA